jgi:hypothetical protein
VVRALGLMDSHCRPVNNRIADRAITSTSARLCPLLASTTGAICEVSVFSQLGAVPRLTSPCAGDVDAQGERRGAHP